MPLPVRPTSRQRYTQEDVQKALNSIKYDGLSISAAAKSYNVPKSTLHDKIRGKYSEEATMGRPSVLTKQEEDHIVQWVLNVAKAGFPVTKEQLIDSVARLIKDLNRPNQFKNNIPGDKWYSLFLGRHPEIAQRVSQALTSSRANVTEEQVRAWFAEVRTYLASKNLLNIFNDPRRVFNADETAFFLCPKGKKVLARRGEKAVYQQTGNDEKECMTVLVNANAAGELAPPMVVFRYERVPPNIVRLFPPEWGLGKSENGWMTRETFFEYVVNVFLPWLKAKEIPFPVVLFIDGHTSHMSLYLSEFCSKNQIEVIALYPNSTHLLQPLDVAVFRPLKVEWKKFVNEWRFRNDGRRMRKEEFSPLLKKVIDKLEQKVIASGFRATGLDSLDPDKVHYNLMLKKGQSTPARLVTLERKASEVRAHLNYLEMKMGLEKVRSFAGNDVEVGDSSLFKVWTEIKEELSSINEEIKTLRPPAPAPTETPAVTQPTVQHRSQTSEEEDVDDVIAFPLPDEDGGQFMLVEGRVIAEAEGSSLDEAGLQNIIDDLGFPNADEGISIEVSVTEVLNSMPDATPERTITSPPLSLTSPPLRDVDQEKTATPEPTTSIPSTSSAGLPTSSVGDLFHSTPTKGHCPLPNMPSPFKRCLPFPSPTSLKKRMKQKEPIPAAVTGESYQNYLRLKEEKKKQMEEDKERRRVIRETKKNIKQEKTKTKDDKRLMESNVETSEDDSDIEPSVIDPEQLKTLAINSWVVVPYEVNGEKKFFPGQIKVLKPDCAGIKYLCRRGNKYIWPEDEDFDGDVPLTEIVQLLSAPVVERRGFFSFKEKIMS